MYRVSPQNKTSVWRRIKAKLRISRKSVLKMKFRMGMEHFFIFYNFFSQSNPISCKIQSQKICKKKSRRTEIFIFRSYEALYRKMPLTKVVGLAFLNIFVFHRQYWKIDIKASIRSGAPKKVKNKKINSGILLNKSACWKK